MDGATAQTDAYSEGRFLEWLEQPETHVEELVEVLEAMKREGRVEDAEARAELVQDALAEKGSIDAALRILELRLGWMAPGGSVEWEKEAEGVLGGGAETRLLLDVVSPTGRIVAPRERVRRLRLLRALKPGIYCHDRTWGLGLVQRVDFAAGRLGIDFERKLGHEMAMAYAVETLRLAGPDHILVWRRTRANELAGLVERDPAEVVRMALRSFGALTAAQLQQALSPAVIPADGWKPFWDKARKGLKADPSVMMPTSRTDTLHFIERKGGAAGDWLGELSRERDLESVVRRLEDYAVRRPTGPLPEPDRRVFLDRIAYVMKGATVRQVDLRARIVLVARALGLTSELEDVRRAEDRFFEGEVLSDALHQLSSKGAQEFLRHLGSLDPARTRAGLLERMPGMPISALSQAIDFLLESGEEAGVQRFFRAALDRRRPTIEQLSWLARDPERILLWDLDRPVLWMDLIMDALEGSYSGERLKARNQLRDRFEKTEWLSFFLDGMDEAQRRKFLLKVRDCPAWPALDRTSVMARIVKLHPSLESVLAARPAAEDAPRRGPVTSTRSYRERQRALERIMSSELPKVARDIAVARSYGDLSENHEFKAAKEHQSMLLHKRGELEKDLRRVTPTDFRGLPHERAGAATTVELDYPDGRRERFFILGEWDADATLGIISCSSRMAQALIGRAAGETVTVPGEHGEREARLTEVGPLPEAILTWAAGP